MYGGYTFQVSYEFLVNHLSEIHFSVIVRYTNGMTSAQVVTIVSLPKQSMELLPPGILTKLRL